MTAEDDLLFQEMLTKSKTIAVVGLSDKPERSSFGVAEYLDGYYEIIPINPNLEQWQGKKVYHSLAEVPEDIKIDLVDVFRRSEFVAEVVDQAIARKIPYLWLQLGVINDEEAERAEGSGIRVVMDACIAVVHNMLKHQGKV
ncbi:MAG: CoA-binding protein [Bdellovibrionota bacterium]